MQRQNLKKVCCFPIIHDLQLLHITGDSRIKIYKDCKSLKHLENGLLVAISLLKLMIRPESLYEKTSEYTSLVGWIKEESGVINQL